MRGGCRRTWKAQALGSGRLFWAVGRAVAKTARKRHRTNMERLRRAILDCFRSCLEANVKYTQRVDRRIAKWIRSGLDEL